MSAAQNKQNVQFGAFARAAIAELAGVRHRRAREHERVKNQIALVGDDRFGKPVVVNGDCHSQNFAR